MAFIAASTRQLIGYEVLYDDFSALCGKTFEFTIRVHNMCFWRVIAIAVASIGNAGAQAPPVDRSATLFAGEWAGVGEGGAYCYLKLDLNGQGWALIDSGSGDLLGAQVRWRNQQQRLQIDEITPVVAAPRLRTMPLAALTLSTGFNRSLRLDWHAQSGTCQMQRTNVSAYQLSHARDVLEKLQSAGGKP